MKKTPQTQQHVNPNLIPMIDIMFLLLLFFMLGADMGHRELEDVRLPQASQVTDDHREDRLTINAHHAGACAACDANKVCRTEAHWKLAFRGEDCTDPEKLATALAGSRDRRVMIRADAGAPFALPQRAMNVCAKEGIFRIEVGAAKAQTR